MRALVLALVFLFSSAASAEYKLSVDKEGIVKYDPAEWTFAGAEADYKLYVLTEAVNSVEKYPIVYTMLEFEKPRELIQSMPSIKRIFTAGIMECPNQIFNLMDDYYVDAKNQIVYVRLYEVDEFVAEVSKPGTARRAVYEKVCAK